MSGSGARLEDVAARSQRDPGDPLRRAALARFSEGGLPSTREEAWKYTDLRRLRRRSLEPLEGPRDAQGLDRALAGLPEHRSARLVFVDGFLDQHRSELTLPDGVELTRLGGDRHPSALGGLSTAAGDRMEALNTALFQDGVGLTVDAGTVVDAPVQVAWWSATGDTPALVLDRLLVELAADSRLTLTEFFGSDAGEDLSVAVAEAYLGRGARLVHHHLQICADDHHLLASLRAELADGARLAGHVLHAGGRLARLHAEATLAGPGASFDLSGVMVPGGKQVHDLHIHADHAATDTRSVQTVQAVLSGRARGVFNGKATIRPDAQRSDVRQSNGNLLLDEGAEMDTKPELEIYADDVKASHGATVGQLDEDALFYLLSRGLDEDEARDLLVFAHAEAALVGIADQALRRWVESRVLENLPQSETLSRFLGDDEVAGP